MDAVKIQNKIAEAENWLTCDCVPCRIMRIGAGKDKIEEYIGRLKAKLKKASPLIG